VSGFSCWTATNVVEFHKLPEFQEIAPKVLRWEERDKRFLIKTGGNGGMNRGCEGAAGEPGLSPAPRRP
jgi:hypothetical protein